MLGCVLWSMLQRVPPTIGSRSTATVCNCLSATAVAKLFNAPANAACLQVCAGRFANPYKLLDLKPDADLRQIKRAYRKKALQWVNHWHGLHQAIANS